MAEMELRPDSHGKVRDIYDCGDSLLMVASDRISAYDFILPDEIPHKGEILTRISAFWFERFADLIPNHMISCDVADLPDDFKPYSDYLAGRSMLVKKAQTVPIECIVRGYLTGSGKKTYDEDGTVCGIKLPAGLTEASKLPEPIFTPSTKAELGDHDENISFERCCEIVGAERPITPRSRASSSPTPSLSSASSMAGSPLSTSASPPTPAASGLPTPTRRARSSRATTSSTSATGCAPTGT